MWNIKTVSIIGKQINPNNNVVFIELTLEGLIHRSWMLYGEMDGTAEMELPHCNLPLYLRIEYEWIEPPLYKRMMNWLYGRFGKEAF